MKQNLSNKISSFEAKTHFSSLLQRVKSGEKFTILNHNSPIAVLMPVAREKNPNVQEIIESLTKFCRSKKLLGLSVKDLISEGRK
jgi:prevent-host-death family protein